MTGDGPPDWATIMFFGCVTAYPAVFRHVGFGNRTNVYDATCDDHTKPVV